MQNGSKPCGKHRPASISLLSIGAVAFIAMLMTTAGCSGTGQPGEPLPPDHFRGTVRDSVVMLDGATAENLVAIEPGVHKYTSSNNGERIAFAKGDVLVNSRGQGSINKVKRVVRQSDTEVILETEQATLEDIFVETDVVGLENFALSPRDAMQNGIVLREGVTLDLSDPSKWTLRISPDHPVFEDDKVQVSMDGELTIAPRIDFLLQFDWWGLKYVKFGVGGAQTSRMEVTIRSKDPEQYAPFEQEIELGSFSLGPKPIYINGVPLLFAPLLTAKVGIRGGIKGRTTAKVSESINLYGGVQYSHYDWQQLGQVTPAFEANPPHVEETKKAAVTAYAKAEVAIGIFGVAAPKCTISGGLKADVDRAPIPASKPWWDLNGVVRVDAGVDVRILSWYHYSYSAPIFDTTIPLCDSNHPQGFR